MKTCKDCIHWEICKDWIIALARCKLNKGKFDVNEICDKFRPKEDKSNDT